MDGRQEWCSNLSPSLRWSSAGVALSESFVTAMMSQQILTATQKGGERWVEGDGSEVGGEGSREKNWRDTVIDVNIDKMNNLHSSHCTRLPTRLFLEVVV